MTKRNLLTGAFGLVIALGIAAPAVTAEEQVVVVGWGGVWQDAYRKALFEPFQKETLVVHFYI